jgi:peptidoglycan hydrolase-like protein with peptidoglycan-binding domain
MNKILQLEETKTQKIILTAGVVMAIIGFMLFGVHNAFAAITTQLDLGSTGSDVSELQTYLSTNPVIYPSHLITGYFGLLTQAGVQRFQTAQGIVTSGTPESTGYGRVGPMTMARINSLLGGGYVGGVSWDTSPVMSNIVIHATQTTVTFNWTTNEATRGQVYINNVPLAVSEATGPGQQPYVSGNLNTDAGGLLPNHSVTVTGLTKNTVYYYVVRSIDSAGNVTMIWPRSVRTDN